MQHGPCWTLRSWNCNHGRLRCTLPCCRLFLQSCRQSMYTNLCTRSSLIQEKDGSMSCAVSLLGQWPVGLFLFPLIIVPDTPGIMERWIDGSSPGAFMIFWWLTELATRFWSGAQKAEAAASDSLMTEGLFSRTKFGNLVTVAFLFLFGN